MRNKKNRIKTTQLYKDTIDEIKKELKDGLHLRLVKNDNPDRVLKFKGPIIYGDDKEAR